MTMSKNLSKKLAIAAAGIAMASSLVACGDSDTAEPTEATVTETVTETSVVESVVESTVTETETATATTTWSEPSSSGMDDDSWDPVRDGGSAGDPEAAW